MPSAAPCSSVEIANPDSMDAQNHSSDEDADSSAGGDALDTPLAPKLPRAVERKARQLPDPAHVSHVTVEQHLDLARQLDESEATRDQLVSETTALKWYMRRNEEQLISCKAERDGYAAAKKELEAERERLARELSQVRTELGSSVMSVAKQKRELEELGGAQGDLQARLKKQSEEAESMTAAYTKLEQRNALLQRQLVAMRGSACAECRIRSLATT